MTEYLISDELLTSIRQACYRAGKAGKEVFTVRTPSEEVVRCRDCKHMHTVRHWLGMDVIECWLHADSESGALGKNGTQPDGFCAWGERREDA